jgi:primosomal protein N'
MYAEVIIDRPIIKRDRRSFVDAPEDADIPYPEVAEDESFAANNPLALTFHYQVPAHLVGQIQPGQLVAVPFRTEQLPAVVVSLSETSPVDQTKSIAAILDPEPVLTFIQIGLAHWLSYETLAPLALCMRYFLPPGSARKSEFVLKPTSIIPKIVSDLNAPEQILLNYLRQHGSVPLTDVEPGVAESLLAKGLVRREVCPPWGAPPNRPRYCSIWPI